MSQVSLSFKPFFLLLGEEEKGNPPTLITFFMGEGGEGNKKPIIMNCMQSLYKRMSRAFFLE